MFTIRQSVCRLCLIGWIAVCSAALTKPANADPETTKRPIRTDISLAVQARLTAERAIPYIEQDGAAWIDDRKCLSCHYVGYMLWSFHDALQRGFPIDQKKFDEQSRWALMQEKNHGVEGAAQILLARDRSDTREQTTKSIEALCDFIISKQETTGFWPAGGQLPSQKRPVAETNQVSTMICILGLATIDPQNSKVMESRNNAINWIRSNSLGGKDAAVSGEWYTMRLLVEKQFGAPADVKTLADQILAAQQPDGGWGWLWADKSDAFGTGLAIYALAEAGDPMFRPAIERAWTFLIETQTDAGSWVVNGTKTAAKNAPHPMTAFWGSTWALLGLCKSLPDSALKTADGN